MLTVLFYLILLVLGIPAGLILAGLCKDEIRNWKKRLFVMSIIAFLLIIIMFFTDFLYRIPVIISLFFIIITCLTIIWKSH